MVSGPGGLGHEGLEDPKSQSPSAWTPSVLSYCSSVCMFEGCASFSRPLDVRSLSELHGIGGGVLGWEVSSAAGSEQTITTANGGSERERFFCLSFFRMAPHLLFLPLDQ